MGHMSAPVDDAAATPAAGAMAVEGDRCASMRRRRVNRSCLVLAPGLHRPGPSVEREWVHQLTLKERSPLHFLFVASRGGEDACWGQLSGFPCPPRWPM